LVVLNEADLRIFGKSVLAFGWNRFEEQLEDTSIEPVLGSSLKTGTSETEPK